MEIHKPHAAKTWREFFIELGTIISGILIALALEQVVEWSREQHRSSEARENIRAEIASNLGGMAVRSALEPCISRRLDEVADIIDHPAAAGPASTPLWIGHPAFFNMKDSQYQAAAQAGHASLLPGGEQAAYASLYAYFTHYNDWEGAEEKAWADIRTLERRPPRSPVLDWQLRSAVQQARIARWTMEVSAQYAQMNAAKLGVAPAKANGFKIQSACLPLHTPRAEALKQVAEGRSIAAGLAFDKP